MNEAETVLFTQELAATFRGSLSEADEAALGLHLSAYEFADVRKAVALLVQEGFGFMPKPGDLVGALKRLSGGSRAVPPAEVMRAFERAVHHRAPFLSPYASGEDRRHAHAQVISEVTALCGEAAGRFVLAHGVEELMREPVDDPVHGGAVRHRLAKSYEQFVAQAAEDGNVAKAIEQAERRALPGGGQPRAIAAVLERKDFRP